MHAPAQRDSPRPAVLELDEAGFRETIGGVIAAAGEPAYRIEQLRAWLYQRTPQAFSELNNVPRSLRQRLEESLVLHPLRHRVEHRSRDGTRKFLWERAASGDIESVVIPDRGRVTYCISTQAGCPVKCTFCATGYGGFQGQLTTAEILDQVVQMRERTAMPPTNIVFMGMGEPLLNFEAVLGALGILTSPRQFGFGARRITVSTVGVPDRIRVLGQRFPQVKLALSLHTARPELRDQLVPLNQRFPLAEVLDAVREHARTAGKKVTFEYVVLPGVNDSARDADEVASATAGIPSRINLLGFNPFPGAPYAKPSVAQVVAFRSRLARRFPGTITIRRSRGEDIQGACGQLSLGKKSTVDSRQSTV
jgi:23S rRNA (adenine2503-C2)-methyltransferase